LSSLLPKPPASLVGVKLLELLQTSGQSLAYIARSEGSARAIADAIAGLAPDMTVVCLPPWDCLPYDRVSPSRQCMGRRMDALRVWYQSPAPVLFITSPDAALQRLPPKAIIETSWVELRTGDRFDRNAFRQFAESTGYVEDGLVDEPGEFAFRADVIDIFPAGQSLPMRIHLDEQEVIAELKSYDPLTQRTVLARDSMIFGPASEAIPSGDVTDIEGTSSASVTERGLFQLYGEMQTVFDLLSETPMIFAAGMDERLETSLEIIREAQQAERDLRGNRRSANQSLYLDAAEWTDRIKAQPALDFNATSLDRLPDFRSETNPRAAFLRFVEDVSRNATVVLAGTGRGFESLCRRIERARDKDLAEAAQWSDVQAAGKGAVLKLACPLEEGFIDAGSGCVLVTAHDVLGATLDAGATQGLAEPELTLGDVVVHEDHGIGILESLETLEVDGERRDAARLLYRDNASLLVPMEDFGKLWRYGSEPEAVSLDRLHTDAWARKREAIAKDVRAAARHLKKLAKERGESTGTLMMPPRAAFLKFGARFPYALTADQSTAIDAVLADLSSGRVMNRLVCGDVGFGKTEVALRAAAAAALSGHQVVVVSPTTVLTRQHFNAFERRFAGTGLTVAMLSRVVSAKEAKAVKEGLASGDIDIVIATHAVLAKDVAFARLGLLIVDEEHRFGTRDKQALRTLAPLLHTLTMSATPIPRTLQTAMVGLQDVSLLTTAPSRRRPVRTMLSPADRATLRVALMREHRRGGQSFVVAPQIQDLESLETMLSEVVPELSIRLAHGKMAAARMDEIMVGFADGDGDVLLSTNIIESGLDVPLANTIFIWRADRFGLAQLHQLRGRVGRGRIQGTAYLLTEAGEEIADETRRRLSTLVENDRLGAGLAISLNDLDLRGGGDLTGDDQAGHMRVIGISLYQTLLERALGTSRKPQNSEDGGIVLNLGISSVIPDTSVPDAAVRLNLYAKLARARSIGAIRDFAQEYEDRFGDLPAEVALLLRLARLKLVGERIGASKLDAGERAMAIRFKTTMTRRRVAALSKHQTPTVRDNDLIYDMPTETGEDRLRAFETLFDLRR
jgi:transcription-repair coupling factor (superfamily II helicase)